MTAHDSKLKYGLGANGSKIESEPLEQIGVSV